MAFYILLHEKDDEGFPNIVRSFVTSFAMMVGDVDYRGTFLQQTGSNFVLIMLFLTLFLILMSILLMNLLTGLAVGDIGVIMRRSLAEKQIQQVMFWAFLAVIAQIFITEDVILQGLAQKPVRTRRKVVQHVEATNFFV